MGTARWPKSVFRVARRTTLALAIAFSVAGFTSIESLFAPDAKLWVKASFQDHFIVMNQLPKEHLK